MNTVIERQLPDFEVPVSKARKDKNGRYAIAPELMVMANTLESGNVFVSSVPQKEANQQDMDLSDFQNPQETRGGVVSEWSDGKRWRTIPANSLSQAAENPKIGRSSHANVHPETIPLPSSSSSLSSSTSSVAGHLHPESGTFPYPPSVDEDLFVVYSKPGHHYCRNDHAPFYGTPIPLALSYNAKTKIFGVAFKFCGWSCQKRFILDHRNLPVPENKLLAINTTMAILVYKFKDKITAAPELDMLSIHADTFGPTGSKLKRGYTIDEYRALGSGGVHVSLLYTPFTYFPVQVVVQRVSTKEEIDAKVAQVKIRQKLMKPISDPFTNQNNSLTDNGQSHLPYSTTETTPSVTATTVIARPTSFANTNSSLSSFSTSTTLPALSSFSSSNDLRLDAPTTKPPKTGFLLQQPPATSSLASLFSSTAHESPAAAYLKQQDQLASNLF